MTLQMTDDRTSRCLMLIPPEILQNHPFLMSRNFETQDCQWYKVKQIKYISVDKENSGTWFGISLYHLK